MPNTKEAAQAVIILLSAYNDNRADRETFIRLAAASLEDYSPSTLKSLCHPKTGLISKNKFMPSIAEMHDFCRSYVNPDLIPLPAPIAEPEVTQAERKRMIQRFEYLLKSLGRVQSSLEDKLS